MAAYFFKNMNQNTSHEESRDVLIARVTRVYGTRGEVGLKSFTDHPERFAAGRVLHIDCGGQRAYVIEKCHPSGADFFRVKLKGVDNRGEAALLTRCPVYIHDSERHRDEGEIYPDEIIGFSVCNSAGDLLGTVVDSEAGLTCSFFSVRPARPPAPGKKGSPVQVPLVQGGFVSRVDRDNRTLVLAVDSLEALFEEDLRDPGDGKAP